MTKSFFKFCCFFLDRKRKKINFPGHKSCRANHGNVFYLHFSFVDTAGHYSKLPMTPLLLNLNQRNGVYLAASITVQNIFPAPAKSGKTSIGQGRSSSAWLLSDQNSPPSRDTPHQGVTRRCRLSLLTNSTLIYQSKRGGMGRGCGVSANEYSYAHHVTWSPNKLWRSNSIFNLCPHQ
jgi:hypothetical protein